MANIGNNVDDGIEQPLARGRVAGSYNRHSAAAIKKLKDLGFDPIEKLVEQYNEVCEEIADLQKLKTEVLCYADGTPTRRFSAMALANLLTVKNKITSDLLRYGYARVPEALIVENNTTKRVVFKISKKGKEDEKVVEGSAIRVEEPRK